jgi:hypothetical protein
MWSRLRLGATLYVIFACAACGSSAACLYGQMKCGDQCVDLATDPANCGDCGAACGADQVCADSSCQCPAGQSECAGQCVDLTSDGSNCGSCGTTCIAPQYCSASACVCTASGGTCTDSSQCCAGLDCLGGTCGTCTDPSYPQYCPELGGVCAGSMAACSTLTQCPDGHDYYCNSSALSVDCNSNHCVCPTDYPVYCPPTGPDEGTCWATGADCTTVTDCGGTPYACFSGEHYDCSTSKCYCDSGLSYCAGVSNACISLQSDVNNCGSCGHVCPGGEVCSGGSCQVATPTCPPGETYCSGYGCVDLSTNWSNCGFCGNSCHSDPVCDPGFGCISCYYECESSSCVQIMCSG